MIFNSHRKHLFLVGCAVISLFTKKLGLTCDCTCATLTGLKTNFIPTITISYANNYHQQPARTSIRRATVACSTPEMVFELEQAKESIKLDEIDMPLKGKQRTRTKIHSSFSVSAFISSSSQTELHQWGLHFAVSFCNDFFERRPKPILPIAKPSTSFFPFFIFGH